jgi:hypothetical protein
MKFKAPSWNKNFFANLKFCVKNFCCDVCKKFRGKKQKKRFKKI